jgi:hypothetical protein
VKQRRTLSASARMKIASAQRARWPRVRAQNVVSVPPKRAKRTLLASERRKTQRLSVHDGRR